jgi:hypothetical protein
VFFGLRTIPGWSQHDNEPLDKKTRGDLGFLTITAGQSMVSGGPGTASVVLVRPARSTGSPGRPGPNGAKILKNSTVDATGK